MNYKGPGIYRHYKGGMYEAIGLAIREETAHKEGPYEHALKECVHCGSRGTESVCDHCHYKREVNIVVVIYKPLTPGSMLESPELEGIDFWERALADFNGNGLVPDARGIDMTVPRFVYAGPAPL